MAARRLGGRVQLAPRERSLPAVACAVLRSGDAPEAVADGVADAVAPGATAVSPWRPVHHDATDRALAAWGPRAAVGFAVVALLLAFQQVVQGSVDRGASRHRAEARHADATWRCRALRDAGERTDCLDRLGPAR